VGLVPLEVAQVHDLPAGLFLQQQGGATAALHHGGQQPALAA
jgi:hypothetical protein